MKPLTLRNVPPDVERAIRRRARERGLSLNKAIITLLEGDEGTHARRKGVVYHDLDYLAGTWSAKDAAEFDAALEEQRRIDEELWE